MMERRQIVAAAQAGDGRVLVTLVHVAGSSYRQTGARLLTSGDIGEYVGTISGGCLEAEVVKKALWKVRGGPVVEQYSTLYDDTAEIPFGLGCGGTVGLLFEAAGTPEYEALMLALAKSLQGEEFTVLTWIPGSKDSEPAISKATIPGARAMIPGARATKKFARAILDAEGGVVFASAGLDVHEIPSSIVDGSRWDASTGGVHVERLAPPQRLVVLGAGDDAKPLVRMAALIGWTVVVADSRNQLARSERFPEAQRVLSIAASSVASLDLRATDAVVLMTHSYEQDRDWLASVLPIAPRYFGVLGAKHRSSLLVTEASVITGLPLAACCELIYAPVGLDLGGDGPEAIALAVISEAHACCMGKLGKSLRLSVDDVSAQIKSGGGGERYFQAQCALPAGQIR